MYTKGRKIVRSLRYKSMDEIDETVLSEVLQDAFSVRGKGFWDQWEKDGLSAYFINGFPKFNQICQQGL